MHLNNWNAPVLNALKLWPIQNVFMQQSAGLIGDLTVREVCFKTRPEDQVWKRRIEELIVRCMRCLWYCTDTVQSGRIFGMPVVTVGSSDSLVFTDGQLKLRSRSGYGFEVPLPGMPVEATIYHISKVPPSLLFNRRRQLLPQSKAHAEWGGEFTSI